MKASVLTSVLGILLALAPMAEAQSLQSLRFCPELQLSDEQAAEIKALRRQGRQEKIQLKKALRSIMHFFP